MERLTARAVNGLAYLCCKDRKTIACDKSDCVARFPCKNEQEAINKLTAYEDAYEEGRMYTFAMPLEEDDLMAIEKISILAKQMVEGRKRNGQRIHKSNR